MWMLMLLRNCVGKYNSSEMWMLMLFCASVSFGVKCLFAHYSEYSAEVKILGMSLAGPSEHSKSEFVPVIGRNRHQEHEECF